VLPTHLGHFRLGRTPYNVFMDGVFSMRMKSVRRLGGLIAFVALWLSLGQPAVLEGAGDGGGKWVLAGQFWATGWMGPTFGHFEWFANLGMAWNVIHLLSGRSSTLWVALTSAAVIAITPLTFR
jgi:hypothetical protein